IEITSNSTSGTVIAGNFLGTLDGSTATGNGEGIVCDDCTGLTVGGSVPADRNLISDNINNGIKVTRLSAAPLILTIRGNLIETNATATAALGNQTGILLETTNAVADAEDLVTIGGFGGAAIGEKSNIIAGNLGMGIDVVRTTGEDAADNMLQLQV